MMETGKKSTKGLAPKVHLPKRLNSIRTTSLLLVVVAMAALGLKYLVPSHAATANFTISGSQIIDPDGKAFVPVGADADGPYAPWPGPLLGQSSLTQNAWKWNTLRLISCQPQGCENGGGLRDTTNNDLTSIINEYTAKHIVIIIDYQQLNPGTVASGTQLTDMISWWTNIANTYKNNPYVWFNLFNEPGGGGSGDLPAWSSVSGQVAAVIRNQGANNVIVMDAYGDGQDIGPINCNPDVDYSNSSIINGGPALASKYKNILFDLHVYGWWGGGNDGACTQAQLMTRFGNYADHVHSAGLAFVVGELGAENTPAEEAWYEKGTTDAYHAVYAEAPSKGVGLLVWHAAPWGNNFPLVQNFLGWTAINSQTNPTNLTTLGQVVWNYGQAQAKVAQQTPASPTPSPTPTILGVGSYNDTAAGLTYDSSWLPSTNAGEYQGDDHYSDTTGDSMTMNFTGTQVRYWFSQASHHGIANISIDGKAPTAVDLYAATRTDGTASWLSPVLPSGTHTLKITVSGTRNPNSTDNVVVIDRIDVISAAPTLVGDLNADGHVTAADLAILLSHWNQTVTTSTNGDLNADGKVSSADLALLLSNWGK